MSRQFTALRVIGTIFKILAWMSLILGLLVAIGALLAGFAIGDELGITGVEIGGPLGGIAAFIGGVVSALISFLLFYAAGEAVYLFLCIEENTRRAAYYIQQQAVPSEGSYSGSPSTPAYGRQG
jgi:hypothetical protein